MLRVSDNPPEGEENSSYLSIDKKKRQVTLSDTTTNQASQSSTTAAQERGPMVSAPKMFAFDGLFTTEDNQVIISHLFILSLHFSHPLFTVNKYSIRKSVGVNKKTSLLCL